MKRYVKSRDKFLRTCIWLSALFTIGVLLWILLYILINGIQGVRWEFLTSTPREVENALLPMIVSTLLLVLLSLTISTPIGIFAAIYLVEYAKSGKLVRIIRFATESLSGIPSIIYGLFGMTFFYIAFGLSFSLLSGSITLSIMILPNIIRTTEESLRAVPNSFREGSLGLGATKLRTIMYIIVPSALPGIITAIILNIGRIVGESAAVYLTAGMVPEIPRSIMDSGRTLSVHMYLLASEMIDFHSAYTTATVLIIIILIINFAANKVGSFISKKRGI